MLTSLSGIFRAITADDIWFRYTMLVVAIGAFFVMQFTGGALALSSQSAVPRPPSSKEAGSSRRGVPSPSRAVQAV